MEINYLEDQFLSKTLFLHEEFLEINYIPDILIHRETELILLSKIFVKLLEDPFLISRKVTIQGEIGIGKTVIAKTFGKMLLMSSEKRNLNIKYIHINCRKEKTPYNILNRIFFHLNCKFSSRGYSVQELITFLEDYLKKSQIYLVLTLDELNYLQFSNFNLIYSLSRLNETNYDRKNFISLIIIVRNLILLGNLDDSTKSTLQGNIISLKKYTKNQIIDILSARIKISIKQDVFSTELIEYIASQIESSGDIRKGLNIIRNSTKIAESKELDKVSKKEIDSALNNIIPNLQFDIIDSLNLHENILLFSILDSIIDFGESKITFVEIKENYGKLCLNLHKTPRKNTQLWIYLQHFANFGLISINTISKNIKGRKSFISINDLPIETMHKKLGNKIRSFNSQM
ncbi:MAG: AAA family ATPase [Candidatus Lokiarchaeota archaeon]|nr:AAA family ATPase [Candidatus Harpocratesius repetitus]